MNDKKYLEDLLNRVEDLRDDMITFESKLTDNDWKLVVHPHEVSYLIRSLEDSLYEDDFTGSWIYIPVTKRWDLGLDCTKARYKSSECQQSICRNHP